MQCVVDIKMKAEVKDGCGPGEVGTGPLASHFAPLACICFKTQITVYLLQSLPSIHFKILGKTTDHSVMGSHWLGQLNISGIAHLLRQTHFPHVGCSSAPHTQPFNVAADVILSQYGL